MQRTRFRLCATLLLLFVLAGFLLGSVSRAQIVSSERDSVGFRAPDSTRPVRAYRLPSWHWSRWTLNGRGSAQWQSSDREDRERSRGLASLALRPEYQGFWESEERMASLAFAPSVSLGTDNSSSESDTFDDRERDRTSYSLGLASQGDLREYVGEQTFLVGDGNVFLSYGRESGQTQRENEEERSRTRIQSDVELDARLGVGIGRVRVVTPVIRALRVRERLRTVSPGVSMSDEQVQVAAQQLARRPGYRAVYDRPDKAFWRDFFEDAGVADRTPFETFYVADVLREPIGVRREGRELQIGPLASYDRRLDRREEEGILVERMKNESKTLGAFARGQWYRNLTLNHQLGVDLETEYRRFLEGDSGSEAEKEIDHKIRGLLTGQWLWVIADRLRLDTRLQANLFYEKDAFVDGYRSRQQYALFSDLLIFVENSLSLSVGGNLRYSSRESVNGDTRSELGVDLRFRVNYILSRALR